MTYEGASVGIIANPASGRDIRRLVAHATTVDNQGKVGIIRRVLIGLGAMGVSVAYGMPDSQYLVQQAASDLAHTDQPVPRVRLMDMAVTHRPADSQQAAERMVSLGVRCIVVLGGDGTARMVAKGSSTVPLVPISTGTNNVLPDFMEGTIAGMAAAAVARALVSQEEVTYRHKRLDVMVNGSVSDMALVDLALLRARFVGARAIWRAGDLERIAVTRASPAGIGVTSIAGMVERVPRHAPFGLALELDPGARRQIMAVLGPGLIEDVGVSKVVRLKPEHTVAWPITKPTVLAFDGEREMTLKPGDLVHVTLRPDGPWIVDAHRVMDALAVQRLTHNNMEAHT